MRIDNIFRENKTFCEISANNSSNIIALDCDAGASEVNQENRIKLMLSVAKERIEAAKGQAV